jgi:hypothetical protein
MGSVEVYKKVIAPESARRKSIVEEVIPIFRFLTVEEMVRHGPSTRGCSL